MRLKIGPAALFERRPSLDLVNRLYMGPVIAWTPVIGSMTSILVNGAGLWAIIRLSLGHFPLARSAHARLVATAFLFFFLVEAASALINYNGYPALREIVENSVFLFFLPVYSRLSISTREDVRGAVETAAAAGAFATLVFTLIQLLTSGDRVEGGAGNATPFAMACMMTFCVTVLATFRSKGRRRLLFLVASAAVAAGVVLSGTRGLWPALVAVPICSALIYRRYIDRRAAGKLGLIALVIGLAVGAAAWSTIAHRIALGLNDIHAALYENDFSGSIGQRLQVWKIGWELFVEAPIFGQGPGRAQLLLAERGIEMKSVYVGYSHYHNALLNYAVRDGLFGALAVLTMLLTPVVLAVRHSRDELGDYGLALIAGTAGSYALSGFFGLSFGHDIFDAMYVIMMIYGCFLVFQPR